MSIASIGPMMLQSAQVQAQLMSEHSRLKRAMFEQQMAQLQAQAQAIFERDEQKKKEEKAKKRSRNIMIASAVGGGLLGGFALPGLLPGLGSLGPATQLASGAITPSFGIGGALVGAGIAPGLGQMMQQGRGF